MIRLELIIVNLLQFTNMAASRGLVTTVMPVSLNLKRIQYLGHHSKTTCQQSAKSMRCHVRPKFEFYRTSLLKGLNLLLIHNRQFESYFSHTNTSNSRRPLQSLLLRYTPENAQVTEYLNMLFQLVLTNFFKSELFSCLRKVDHMIKSCKEPIAEEVEVYQRLQIDWPVTSHKYGQTVLPRRKSQATGVNNDLIA